MTGNEQSQLRFDISEDVRFYDEQPGIGTLLSLDLTPEVRIEDLGATVRIEGVIRLSGTYLAQSMGTPEQHAEQVAEASESDATATGEEIHYVIPVEITLPAERAARLEDITAEIQSFDYELRSPHELTIEALLVVDGLHLGNADNASSTSFGEQEADQAFIQGHDAIDESQGITGAEEAQEVNRWEQKRQQEHEDSDQESAAQSENHQQASEAGTSEPEPPRAEAHAEEKETPVEETEAHVDEPEAVAHPEDEPQPETISQTVSEQAKPETKIHFQTKPDKEAPDAISLNELLQKDNLHEEDDQPDMNDVSVTDYPSPQKTDEASAVAYSDDESIAAETEAEMHDSQTGETGNPTGIAWMKQKLAGAEDHFHRLRMVIVQKEDTLESIADRYELSSVELLQVNKLESGELEQGQIVYLPDRDR